MSRRAILVAVLLAPALLTLGVAWAIYQHVHIDVPPRLGPEARAAAMAPLRAAVDGRSHERPRHPELERRLAHRGPVLVSVWRRGERVARVQAHGVTAADAIERAASQLAAGRALRALPPTGRHTTRIQVDLAVGRGPLVRAPEVLAPLGLHPGIEGVGVTLDDDDEVLLLPMELVAQRLLTSERPLPFIPEFEFGFDFERADMALAAVAALPAGGYGAAQRAYWRFHTDSFVEPPPGDARPPLALTRLQPPGPPPTAANLRAAAIEGGRYLVAHLAPSGRYVYQADLATGHASDPRVAQPYSLPRHAGTTYFLAELYRHTGEDFLREPIERAFDHLAELVEAGGCEGELADGEPFACVVDKGRHVAALGSAALTVVALVEYRRATGQGTYDQLTRRLGAWILSMQRDDGSFAHLYDVRAAERDEDAELLYFSGEAALALARLHEVYGDPRYADGAERALGWLVDWYDFFGGGFFFGEEHWTCIAAEAAWPASKNPAYLDFCRDYGAFLRRQQIQPGDFATQDDLAGSYGFTPFFPPQNTPAGSRTEAMISAYELSRHHGAPDAALRAQIVAAMGYALRQQVRADSDWWVPARVQGRGGVPASPVDRRVRIDYVQHVCSAMIRTAALLDAE